VTLRSRISTIRSRNWYWGLQCFGSKDTSIIYRLVPWPTDSYMNLIPCSVKKTPTFGNPVRITYSGGLISL
jgi:hypothetical protein